MWLIRFTLIILSAIGVWGVGRISLAHWLGESSCPMVAGLPICYVILVGYGLVFLSALFKGSKQTWLFFIGWLPVTIFAFIGIIGELMATVSCPVSDIGIPKCYFSALLSVTIGVLYWRLRRTTRV